MWKEFKAFISKGNVMALAIGVVIGGAFTNVVNSVVTGLISPLVELAIKQIPFFKDGNMDGLSVAVEGITFNFGDLISAILTFFITAFVVFGIFKAISAAENLAKPKTEDKEDEKPEEDTKTDEYLKAILEEIKK